MKKMLACLLTALLLFALAVPALGEDDRTITVSGSATISLRADMATLQIGVETTSQDVTQAQSQNAYEMNNVIAALKNAGVSEEDMVTSNFNVWSGYEYSTSSLGAENRTLVYTVSNTLSVTVRDLDAIGSLIDVAANAGANQMHGLTFSATQSADAYQQALQQAVADAARKAGVLCDAANVTLGKLIRIDAQETNYNYTTRNVYTAKEASADGAAIVSGDVQVSATITLTYGIR